MEELIKKILREEEREKHQSVSLDIDLDSGWKALQQQNEKKMKEWIDAIEWELLTQGLEIEEEEFEEPQVIHDLNALIKAIEEGKKDNYLMRTKNFKRLNLDKEKLAFWRNHLNKPEVQSVWAKAKGKIKNLLDVFKKDDSVALHEYIKKTLREEYWQVSDDDKWNNLEKDLRYIVERLIERHKDSWGGDQYAVMGAIEQVLEGMFQKVSINEALEDSEHPVEKLQGRTDGQIKGYSPDTAEFFQRLSILLKHMKSIDGLDTWIQGLHEYGNPRGYGGNSTFQQSHRKIHQGIWGILKMFTPLMTSITNDELTYLVVKTFLVNGGYTSDFNPTNIKLPTITIYDVEAEKEQAMIEFSTGFGSVIGAENEQMAIDMYTNHPGTWEQDSDHHDNEYGDVMSIDNVRVYESHPKYWKSSYLGL